MSDHVTTDARLDQKIVITGAAGLVGQNLCLKLNEAGYTNIVGIDKHKHNLQVLRDNHPYVRIIDADLADQGDWMDEIRTADTVVLNQAQIGGLVWDEFERNNITATQNILEAIDRTKPPYIVHISSSVVNSLADDFYTRSKTTQEEMVREAGYKHCVLRPTLMFGWFDRKHLGWLRRFMDQSPLFPIPSHGKYIRQPLYEGDFCRVIMGCIAQQPDNEVFDISGQEKIFYKDMIRTIKGHSQRQGDDCPHSLSIILGPAMDGQLGLEEPTLYHTPIGSPGDPGGVPNHRLASKVWI